MLKDVVFISMEGKPNFKFGDFSVREDIALPVFIGNKKFTIDMLTPDNIISGMIKVIASDIENEHVDYYRQFIFSVNPNIEAKLSAVAYEASRNQHFDQALEIYSVLFALLPNSIEQALNIAICYDDFSNYLFSIGNENEAVKYEDQAFQFFKKVDSFEEKTERALYYLGRFYLARENYEKSIEYFKDFTRVTQDQDRKNEVIKVIDDIVKEGTIDEDYQSALGLIQADKEKEAMGFIDKFFNKYPDSWNAYFIKGWALRKMEQFDEAIKYYNEAIKLNPDSSDVYNELGICYMNLKDFSKSELNFEKALKKAPDDSSIIFNLALCAFKKGDIKEALKYCEVILEFNPKDLQTKKLKKMIEESNN